MTVSQAFQIALEHHQAGRLAEAETLYRQILAVQPRHADALHLLGVLAHQAGRQELAIEWIGQALEWNPNHAVAHSNLGEALRTTGRLQEAIASYRRAIELNPASAEAHSNLGGALLELGKTSEATSECRRAIELRSDYPEAHNNLGNALREEGEFEGAIAHYKQAIKAAPRFVAARNNLGDALKQQGLVDEAIAAFRLALEINPANAFVWSNLIYTLLFVPHSEEAIRREQMRWNCQFRPNELPKRGEHRNSPIADRRLRIGYVSGDFRNHVIGRNLIPLFEAHDRDAFEILCYSGAVHHDAFTQRFRALSDHWRETIGLDDSALAERIREDSVDILVDLSQHLAGNRLTMFTHRPAPVQVSFAGYPESAGLEAIPYRISDRHLEINEEDGDCSASNGEKAFLIDSFWCYRPGESGIAVNESPVNQRGFVTFGSLNNFCKINDAVVKLWAKILAALPASRLVLLCCAGSHRARTAQAFQELGIEASRIEFVEPQPHFGYLQLYHRLDIVLDPFPYNGHTTSLDALWMGVPVVTLAGQAAISRAGLSQLTHLGLMDLIARNEDEYVVIATSLARDATRLAELRRSLRERMGGSAVMNAAHFARQIEAAYRQMWRQWCEAQPARFP